MVNRFFFNNNPIPTLSVFEVVLSAKNGVCRRGVAWQEPPNSITQSGKKYPVDVQQFAHIEPLIYVKKLQFFIFGGLHRNTWGPVLCDSTIRRAIKHFVFHSDDQFYLHLAGPRSYRTGSSQFRTKTAIFELWGHVYNLGIYLGPRKYTT